MRRVKKKKDNSTTEALKEFRREWAKEHEDILKEAEEENEGTPDKG